MLTSRMAYYATLAARFEAELLALHNEIDGFTPEQRERVRDAAHEAALRARIGTEREAITGMLAEGWP